MFINTSVESLLLFSVVPPQPSACWLSCRVTCCAVRLLVRLDSTRSIGTVDIRHEDICDAPFQRQLSCRIALIIGTYIRHALELAVLTQASALKCKKNLLC